MVGAGFEPAKLARQIYSLIPLATREPHPMLRHFIHGALIVKLLYYGTLVNTQLLDHPSAAMRILEKLTDRCNAFAALFCQKNAALANFLLTHRPATRHC